jgi:hypothetical protein
MTSAVRAGHRGLTKIYGANQPRLIAAKNSCLLQHYRTLTVGLPAILTEKPGHCDERQRCENRGAESAEGGMWGGVSTAPSPEHF